MEKENGLVKKVLQVGTLACMLVKAPIIANSTLPSQESMYSSTPIVEVNYSSPQKASPIPQETTLEETLESTPSKHGVGDRVTIGNHDYIYKGTMKALVTAYCPCEKCCEEDANGLTALGDNAYDFDGVATASNGPAGSRDKVFIPGAGEKEVDDTGGAMRQSLKKGIFHIDLRMNHEDALVWGRKDLDVEVYDRILPEYVEVKRGTTLSGIANEYGVLVSDLIEKNNGINPRTLKLGQKIYLPKQG